MSELRRPEYWEPDEIWEQYWAALRVDEFQAEPLTELQGVMAGARIGEKPCGREDLEAAVRFGNWAYGVLKRSATKWLAQGYRHEGCVYGQTAEGGGCGYSLAKHTRADGRPMGHDYSRRCSVCDGITPMACSDCRIDTGKTVYVCGKSECRRAHEAAHPEHQAKMVGTAHKFEPNRQCSGLTCEICGENQERCAELQAAGLAEQEPLSDAGVFDLEREMKG